MRLHTIIAAALTFVACASNPTENPQDYAINCHIEGEIIDRPESDKLLLFVGIEGKMALSSEPYKEIDIRNGKFTCDIYINEAQYCELVFEDEYRNRAWHQVDFVADNGTIKMTLYPEEEYGKNTIEGAGHTAEYQSYKLRLRELQNATNEVREQLKAEGRYNSEQHNSLIAKIEAIKENTPERNSLIEQLQAMTEEQTYTPEALTERADYKTKRKSALLEIVNGEPSIARLTMLARQMVYSLPEQEFIDAFNNIYAVKMPDNSTTQFCQRQIAGFGLQIGSQYVDFEAPDIEGQMHKLSDLTKGAEIVMLDLWASWCGPCRKASIEMIPLYEKYNDKGFKIIGVARESGSTKAMEKAIKQDGYKWPQLVEMDDRANIWAQYGCINAAGRRILFDGEGKIIAFDPTIEQLTAEVEKHINK